MPASHHEQQVGASFTVHSFIFSTSYSLQPQFGDLPWRCGDPYRYGPPKTGNSWTKCHELTEKYDNDMCDAWKEEVDKLLIFVRTAVSSISNAFIRESLGRFVQRNRNRFHSRSVQVASGRQRRHFSSSPCLHRIPSWEFIHISTTGNHPCPILCLTFRSEDQRRMVLEPYSCSIYSAHWDNVPAVVTRISTRCSSSTQRVYCLASNAL